MIKITFRAKLRGKKYVRKDDYSVYLVIPRAIIFAYGLEPKELVGKTVRVSVEIPEEQKEEEELEKPLS